jgi:hypothetical protein
MGEGQSRDDTGEFSTPYPDRWFIEALRELGGSAGKSQICEVLNEKHGDSAPARRTVQNRLERLNEEGRLGKERVGSGETSAIRWYLSDEGKERVIRQLREAGIAGAKAHAANIDGLDEGEVEEILHKLEEEGEVESENIGGTLVWKLVG